MFGHNVVMGTLQLEVAASFLGLPDRLQLVWILIIRWWPAVIQLFPLTNIAYIRVLTNTQNGRYVVSLQTEMAIY